MKWRLLGVGLPSLVAVVALVLFAIQNSTRTTQLSFDLGFAAWELAEPIPIPALIGASVVVGVILGGAFGAMSALRTKRKLARVEQELALKAGQSSEWG